MCHGKSTRETPHMASTWLPHTTSFKAFVLVSMEWVFIVMELAVATKEYEGGLVWSDKQFDMDPTSIMSLSNRWIALVEAMFNLRKVWGFVVHFVVCCVLWRVRKHGLSESNGLWALTSAQQMQQQLLCLDLQHGSQLPRSTPEPNYRGYVQCEKWSA